MPDDVEMAAFVDAVLDVPAGKGVVDAFTHSTVFCVLVGVCVSLRLGKVLGGGRRESWVVSVAGCVWRRAREGCWMGDIQRCKMDSAEGAI